MEPANFVECEGGVRLLKEAGIEVLGRVGSGVVRCRTSGNSVQQKGGGARMRTA